MTLTCQRATRKVEDVGLTLAYQWRLALILVGESKRGRRVHDRPVTSTGMRIDSSLADCGHPNVRGTPPSLMLLGRPECQGSQGTWRLQVF